MQTTNISWADYSWNPITGCSHAGPECTNCYAETFSRRQGRTDHPWTVENAEKNVTMHPDRLTDPDEYHWPEGPGRTFVGSMTDMFHGEVDPEFTQQVLDKCGEHPEQVFIFLTKRPQNAAAWRLDWPSNVWIGASVGSGPGGKYPNTTHRVEQLRDVDAEVLWVSFEPLIEEIGEVALDHISWAVVGGETASKDDRRDMEHEWAEDLFRQCREADVAYYFKQSSGQTPESGTDLSVFNEEYGIYEQRHIREFPDVHETVRRARRVADREETPA